MLQAMPAQQPVNRSGIRNALRVYADAVFDKLPGQTNMLTSANTTWNQKPPFSVKANDVYIVCHGDYTDGTKYWGEDNSGNYPTAFTIANVPDSTGTVVLSASCWSRLTVDIRAGEMTTYTPVKQRTADTSIALAFLARGAAAFVAPTGSTTRQRKRLTATTDNPYTPLSGSIILPACCQLRRFTRLSTLIKLLVFLSGNRGLSPWHALSKYCANLLASDWGGDGMPTPSRDEVEQATHEHMPG
jgi:hypothetical protein